MTKAIELYKAPAPRSFLERPDLRAFMSAATVTRNGAVTTYTIERRTKDDPFNNFGRRKGDRDVNG